MKLRTWVKLCKLIEQYKNPDAWRYIAYYTTGWGILIYIFALHSSFWNFGIVLIAVLLIAKGLSFGFTEMCPAEENCPFKDRLLNGYWEKRK